jgi:hypothetical protein
MDSQEIQDCFYEVLALKQRSTGVLEVARCEASRDELLQPPIHFSSRQALSATPPSLLGLHSSQLPHMRQSNHIRIFEFLDEECLQVLHILPDRKLVLKEVLWSMGKLRVLVFPTQ